ncbi:MAG: response regulator [Gammaproteobacteria bacterium]|nr:response regulator [Gammaproteobacteria bacterium]
MATEILLIEDHPDNRDMLARRLTRIGYTVHTAVNGEEGVQAVYDRPPELILMDVSMPIMDGIEATRHIKSDPDYQHIPIIGISGHTLSEERERMFAAGANDYTHKPIDFNKLSICIKQWLSH